jgi:hypothetical protein
MPLDDRNYRDFRVRLMPDDVASPSITEVRVDPALNDGANILCFYGGTLLMSQKGESSRWIRGFLNAPVYTAQRQWSPKDRGAGWTRFRDGSVTVSLAAIYNVNEANNAGWAVDAAEMSAIDTTHLHPLDDHLEIRALLAVSDSDGILYRLSYSATALGVAS